MNYLLFLFLGLAPSLIWLAFYLRKDAHPEPNSMILKVFIFGGAMTIPVFFIELGLKKIFEIFGVYPFLTTILYIFLGIALIEELAKYSVVRWKVFSNSALDEPLDLMLYMIIAGLGFAALENIFIFFGLGDNWQVQNIVALGLLRFVGATFLHALSSGLFGYFLVLFYASSQKWYFYFGLISATLLHGIFNYYILKGEGGLRFIILLSLFITTALFLSFAFRKLKEMKSICNI